MNEAKKISVIMGVYNSDKAKLSRAIESILNQTYTNFEFIICDDCSTNCIHELVEEYAIRDERIIFIKNDVNSGLAYSLNSCLRIANGEYIARMDDDDISDKYRFEKQVWFLNHNKDYSFVGCSLWLMDSNGVWGESFLKEVPNKDDLLFGAPFAHPTIMVRKSAYDAVSGYRVLKKTRRTEDYDLYLRLYEKDLYGYNLQEKLYTYTQSMDTLSKRKFIHRIDEVSCRLEGFEKLGLFPKGLIYVFKPIISGFIPNYIKQRMYKSKYSIEKGDMK